MIRVAVVALIILLVVMAVTNPNQDAHKKVVYDSIAASKTNSEVLGKIAADVLGKTDLLPITYNNYIRSPPRRSTGKWPRSAYFPVSGKRSRRSGWVRCRNKLLPS